MLSTCLVAIVNFRVPVQESDLLVSFCCCFLHRTVHGRIQRTEAYYADVRAFTVLRSGNLLVIGGLVLPFCDRRLNTPSYFGILHPKGKPQ